MIKNKFLVLLTLSFLLVVGVWFFLNQQDVTTVVVRNEVDTLKPQVKVEEISQTRRTRPEFVADDMDDNTQQDNATQEQKYLQMNQDVAQIFELVKQHKYSSDPLIEFMSLFLEYNHCKISKIQIRNLSSHKLQEKLSEQLQKYCHQDKKYEGLFKKYKSESLMQELVEMDSLDSDFSTDYLRIIQPSSEINKTDAVFDFVMRAKSAQLFRAVNNTKNIKVFADAIKNEINSLSSNYNELLVKEGLHHYSCQLSSNKQSSVCSSTGEFMLNKCKDDPLLCGKDSDYWFNHYIYAGHRADIQRIVKILENWWRV